MNYCYHCQLGGVDCDLCFDKLAYLFGWLFIWL